MKLHSAGQQFVVYDEVMSPRNLRKIQERHQRTRLSPVTSTIYPEADGPAFRGPRVALDLAEVGAGVFHELAQAIRSGLNALSITDQPEVQGYGAHWAYPAGSGLGWHDDGSGGIAAFILYLSPTWRASWGGELDIIDCPTSGVPEIASDVDIDLMGAPLNITSVFPAVNRVVILRSGTFHRIRRVDTAVGATYRASLSGFVCDGAVAGE